MLRFNKLSVSHRVYTLFRKTLLLFHTALLKCFICSRVDILDSPWCKNSCRVYQELEQVDFYHLIRKKFHSIKFIYYLSAKKVTARNILLVSISSIAFVTNLTSAGFKNSDFYILLLFLVSSQPSTTS